MEDVGIVIGRGENQTPNSYISLTSGKKLLATYTKKGGIYELPGTKNRVAILPDPVYEYALSTNYDNNDYVQTKRNDLLVEHLKEIQTNSGCNTMLTIK
ncbi:hypothetical protein [Seinonella peptonophila]|uniref:hypothetical protein n=1 Tax=Seinonella peptonophila TaxID=112248 RepID=UPI0011147E57|nr:hypothetical protein [Seinonella peptonophila]